jgi:large subunit ribosomal protein L10
MTLRLEQKKEIVAEVATVANQALSVVAADYRGLTVSEMTNLRASARKIGVKLRVVRNTLARKAFQGTPFECMTDALVGPVLLAFAVDEPSASARLMRDFVKTNEKLKVKALSLGGQLYGGQHLEAIAKLPTRIEAIGRFASVLQAPLSKFARTLGEVPTKFARALSQVRDQKQ